MTEIPGRLWFPPTEPHVKETMPDRPLICIHCGDDASPLHEGERKL